MSLVTERRVCLKLTGEPSAIHDPANLPYEAVRRMWWSGFLSAISCSVIAFLIVAVLFNLPDRFEVPSGPRDVPEISEPAPANDTGTARSRSTQAGGRGRRVPLDAYDPTKDSPSPGVPGTKPEPPPQTRATSTFSPTASGVLVPDRVPNPSDPFPMEREAPKDLFPDTLPGPVPSNPATPSKAAGAFDAHGRSDVHELLAAMRAERHTERVTPLRLLVMRGRCTRICG